jgi:opacity protein-like surface antigen
MPNAMKKTWMHIAFLMLIGTSPALAENFKRFEFQPFGGYTVSGSIPLVGDDDIKHGSIHVNSSYNGGATFAINLNELDAIEAHWQRQFTEGRLPAEMVVTHLSENGTTFNLKIDQYHCNFLHHYEISVPKALPYVMAGLGATTYYANHGGSSGSRTYFSFSLGGGIKYFVSRHIGFRGEARWSPTLVSASDSSFWCSIGGAGATCLVHLKAALQDQLDVTGGIVFRF